MIASAHILNASLRSGDATSQHAFDLARMLHSRGVQTSLLVNHDAIQLPHDLQKITLRADPKRYMPQAELTIVEYPIWFELAQRIRYASAPKIFWYHGVTPRVMGVGELEQELLAYSTLRTMLVWHTNLAITASPFTQEELHRNTDFPLEQIQVVPLAVDVQSFHQPPSPERLAELRQRWNMENSQVLLYVGRISHNKRVDLLVEAMAKLANEDASLHLLIVGDADGSDAARTTHARLLAKAAALGISSRLTFTGRVEHVEPFFHLASIFVTASQHEGFGVPLIEAMAAGIPIVASHSSAIPWVLAADQGEQAAGLTFASGDVDELAQKIRLVLTSPGCREQLIEQGKRRVQAFTHERFAVNTWNAIECAIDFSRKKPSSFLPLTEFLYQHSDVSLKNHITISKLPVIGKWIAGIRTQMTQTLQQEYIDVIINKQIDFNRTICDKIYSCHEDLRGIENHIHQLRSIQRK